MEMLDVNFRQRIIVHTDYPVLNFAYNFDPYIHSNTIYYTLILTVLTYKYVSILMLE